MHCMPFWEKYSSADSFLIPMPIARARSRTARQRVTRSFGIDFITCFAVTFIYISARGATAIAFVRCCFKLLLSSASEEPAIAPPTGSMSVKPTDAVDSQSQPSQHRRSRTSGYTRCAGISGKYSISGLLIAYELTEYLLSRYDWLAQTTGFRRWFKIFGIKMLGSFCLFNC